MILLALILWPLLEIVAAFAVAHAIGVLPCILLILAGWPVGAALMRVEGRATMRRLREALATGRPPAGTAQGALGLLAGPLLIVPGFITDGLAVLMLVPAVRRALWALAARGARDRLGPRGRGTRGARRAFDVDGTAHETTRRDPVLDRTQLHG